MPSFDVVSEINFHEVTNAIDQANRELSSRFDFKNTNSKFVFKSQEVTLITQTEFQLKQMQDILNNKLTKREVPLGCLTLSPPEQTGKEASQSITFKQGIDQTLSKKIVKTIKTAKIKVNTSIQGEQVRVSGKKIDDLQTTIELLKEKIIEQPLQFNNFRD